MGYYRKLQNHLNREEKNIQNWLLMCVGCKDTTNRIFENDEVLLLCNGTMHGKTVFNSFN